MKNSIIQFITRLKNQEGLGILEMIIALAVIITGVLSGFVLAISNFNAINSSHNRLIAFNLAREAVEVIRNKRDTNWISGQPWSDGFFGNVNIYRLVPDFNL